MPGYTDEGFKGTQVEGMTNRKQYNCNVQGQELLRECLQGNGNREKQPLPVWRIHQREALHGGSPCELRLKSESPDKQRGMMGGAPTMWKGPENKWEKHAGPDKAPAGGGILSPRQLGAHEGLCDGK